MRASTSFCLGLLSALLLTPQLLRPAALSVLDEITSALDPELVQEVLQTVKTIAGEGATLLIVTHEMRFARDVSHSVVFMEKGRIAEVGPPAEIFNNPRSPRLIEFLRSSRD